MISNPMATVTRAQRRELERDNAKRPIVLQLEPESVWPGTRTPGLFEVWRSRDFLVQVYRERPGLIRLSVSRTALNSVKRWEDGIAWDDLQRLKRECGRGAFDAVEVYPADRDIINVANLRHLWVFLEQPLDFAWRTE